MRIRRYALPVLVIALALIPTIALATNPFKDIVIAGEASSGGEFSGMLSVDRFERGDSGVVATVSISGTLTDASGAVRQLNGQSVRIPVNIGVASCDAAVIELSATTVDLDGAGVGLATMLVSVAKDAQTEAHVGRLLCQISQASGAPIADSPLASRLNRLMDELR